jgi:hypothetical protein
MYDIAKEWMNKKKSENLSKKESASTTNFLAHKAKL